MVTHWPEAKKGIFLHPESEKPGHADCRPQTEYKKQKRALSRLKNCKNWVKEKCVCSTWDVLETHGYICLQLQSGCSALGAPLATICQLPAFFFFWRMNAERRISITLMRFDSSLALLGKIQSTRKCSCIPPVLCPRFSCKRKISLFKNFLCETAGLTRNCWYSTGGWGLGVITMQHPGMDGQEKNNNKGN